MLKKQNRLTSDFEFNVVKKYGSTISTRLFHLTYLFPNNYTGNTKIGFIISNRFDKSAANRNRIKRLYREAIRNSFDRINEGLWIVIHPKSLSNNASYEDICTEINKTIQEIPLTR